MANFNAVCPKSYPNKCNLVFSEKKQLEKSEKYKGFFMHQFKNNDKFLISAGLILRGLPRFRSEILVSIPLSLLRGHSFLNNTGFMYSLGFFMPAIILCEITIPLLVIVWIIKVVFFLGVLFIGLILDK